jgi:hypothetical protein
LICNRITAVGNLLFKLNNNLTVCDNNLVNDIAGGAQAVYNAGVEYLESIFNNSQTNLDPFKG